MADNRLGIDQLSDISFVGAGGFGEVHSARHDLLDRHVAVKLLARLNNDADRRRFERECRVMARLSDHPHIVTVHNAGFTTDDRPYIMMEFVGGGALSDQLAPGAGLGWRQVVELLVPIADALHHAHTNGVLHRDIKPDNILIGEGQPRLADFGIAQLRDATGAASTHITASWLHTAPETFDNTRDERSDVYSLASTMHAALTGTAPFWRSDDESLSPLMMRLVAEHAPRLPPNVAPPELADLMLRSLSKNPDERPQSAADLGAALAAILAPPSYPLTVRNPSEKGDAAGVLNAPDGAQSSDGPQVRTVYAPPTGLATARAETTDALQGDPSPPTVAAPGAQPPASHHPEPKAAVDSAPPAMVPTERMNQFWLLRPVPVLLASLALLSAMVPLTHFSNVLYVYRDEGPLTLRIGDSFYDSLLYESSPFLLEVAATSTVVALLLAILGLVVLGLGRRTSAIAATAGGFALVLLLLDSGPRFVAAPSVIHAGLVSASLALGAIAFAASSVNSEVRSWEVPLVPGLLLAVATVGSDAMTTFSDFGGPMTSHTAVPFGPIIAVIGLAAATHHFRRRAFAVGGGLLGLVIAIPTAFAQFDITNHGSWRVYVLAFAATVIGGAMATMSRFQALAQTASVRRIIEGIDRGRRPETDRQR